MFGSGIISSHGECSNLLAGNCEVRRFDLSEVLNTTVEVDKIQKVLFAIDDFEQMYEAFSKQKESSSVSQGDEAAIRKPILLDARYVDAAILPPTFLVLVAAQRRSVS
jgi:phenylalanine-4-hydroxylase